MKTVGIIGASGYTGYELIKILHKHKKVSLAILNSEHFNGKSVSSLYEDFTDKKLKFTNISLKKINTMKPDVLFLATPHGAAMEIVPQLDKSIKVIDLSADYRFKDLKVFEKVYGMKHKDMKHHKDAVYGLPELFEDEIKEARLIANPGCYVTASILASLPLYELASHIVFDCKSGWSGAGKKSPYAKDSSLLQDNIIAYHPAKHRHKYEINQFIKNKISFTPHVIDTFRGLMATVHFIFDNNISVLHGDVQLIDKEGIIKMYRTYYHGMPFVKIVKKIPELHDVQGTNECHIGGFELDDDNQLVIVSVLDNLLKGASGQAVQNMNLMLGFDQKEGLV